MLHSVDNRHFSGIMTPDCSYPSSGVEPVVFMHPFFTEYGPKPPEKYLGANAQYMVRRNELFADHSGPLVVFESESYFDYLTDEITKIRGARNLYFVETLKDSPDPIFTSSWAEVYDFLRLFKSGIRVAGGLIKDSEIPNDRGCLGYAMHLLRREGFSVDVMTDLIFL